MESPIKNLWSNFIMEKNQNKIWIVNISEYYHRTMGLLSFFNRPFSTLFINPLKSLGSPDRMLIIHSAMSQIIMTLETCRFSSGVDHCIKSRAKNASEARARIWSIIEKSQSYTEMNFWPNLEGGIMVRYHQNKESTMLLYTRCLLTTIANSNPANIIFGKSRSFFWIS